MDKRIAVLTGASGGIGSVIHAYLRDAGYAVVCLGRREVACEAFYQVDFCSHEELSACLFDIARVFPHIDLLVCTHGSDPFIKPTQDVEISEWERMFCVDVQATFWICRMLYPCFVPGSSIVFTGSFHAIGTYPQRTTYAVAKASIAALARSLAVEWAHQGIHINCIAPGQVYGQRTQRIAGQIGGESTLEDMHARSPSGTLVVPEDIARTVLWLADTPGINGQTIVIDHGVSVNFWYGSYSQRIGHEAKTP